MAEQSRLTTCRTCDGKVATDAPACPHCGAPNPATSRPAPPPPGTKQAVRVRDRSAASSVKIEEPVKVEKKNSYESIKSDGCMGCGCLFAIIVAGLYLALWALGIVDPENS